MARSRNIKPGFFQNEDLAELSCEARLLFIGLWMLADRDGVLEDRPKRIKAAIFPFENYEIEILLEQLCAARVITRYSKDEFKCIWVNKFIKHQNPHKNEPINHLPRHPEIEESRKNLSPPVLNRTAPVINGTAPVMHHTAPADSLLRNPESLSPEFKKNPETKKPKVYTKGIAERKKQFEAQIAAGLAAKGIQ